MLDEQHRAAWAFRNELRRGDTAPVRDGSRSVEQVHLKAHDGLAICGDRFVTAYDEPPNRPHALCSVCIARCADCREALDSEERCRPCDMQAGIEAAEALCE